MLGPLATTIQLGGDLIANHLSALLKLTIKCLEAAYGRLEGVLFGQAGLEIVAHEGLEDMPPLVDEQVDPLHIIGVQGLEEALVERFKSSDMVLHDVPQADIETRGAPSSGLGAGAFA